MAKDPAFLFYHHDFLVGTSFMTLEECGAYVRILCYMADKGSLPLENIKQIYPKFENSPNLLIKFKKDENANYYNERLYKEVEKRKAFCESRRKSIESRYVRTTYDVRMENENRNENEDVNIIENVIKDLNTVCSTNYKFTSEGTRKMALSLLKAGFTLEDFKVVHRKKFDEWGGDPEWSKYLRPSTLYQPKKFESYLNQNNQRSPANMKNIKISQNWLAKKEETDGTPRVLENN